MKAYDNGFFDDIDRASLSSASVIVPFLQAILHARSVIDVGCGRGAWLRAFIDNGASTILGYDGAYVDVGSLLIPQDRFVATDLSRPFSVESRYDLVLCLEVAEHLPHEMSKQLVHTLCSAGDAVVFSAAIPGQGGTNHINEQWPFFWEELFTEHGFVRLDPIRSYVFHDSRVATHFKQNMFLYVTRSFLEMHDGLRALPQGQRNDVTIIASDRLIPLYSTSGLARELWRAIRHAVRKRGQR